MPIDPVASQAVAEIIDLWVALFGEPPPVRAAPGAMIEALVGGLPIEALGAPPPADEVG